MSNELVYIGNEIDFISYTVFCDYIVTVKIG